MRWRTFIVLLVGLAAVSTGSSAPVHYPAENGWIVFASDRVPIPFSSYGLYRLDPVGSRVTGLALAGEDPAWSPDGSMIAFSDRDTGSSLLAQTARSQGWS